MADANDSESSPDWIDDPRTTRPEAAPRIDVFTDTRSDTVTFASRQREDGQTTTAWIAAEASFVVSRSEML